MQHTIPELGRSKANRSTKVDRNGEMEAEEYFAAKGYLSQA
jgi:hypothetical protein